MLEMTIRIDNSQEEFANLLGGDFMNFQLVNEPFAEGATVQEFWKQAGPGIFLLLTQSKKQPTYGPSVHVTVLRDGTIRNATSKLLRKKLVSVQRVLPAQHMLN